MTGERTLSAAREYKASWSVNSLPTYKKQSVMIQLQGCLNDMSTCSLVTLMDVIVMMAFFFSAMAGLPIVSCWKMSLLMLNIQRFQNQMSSF